MEGEGAKMEVRREGRRERRKVAVSLSQVWIQEMIIDTYHYRYYRRPLHYFFPPLFSVSLSLHKYYVIFLFHISSLVRAKKNINVTFYM